ncbi:hypothetical protein ACVWZX_004556 [Deinococcus sp. UYEF24]
MRPIHRTGRACHMLGRLFQELRFVHSCQLEWATRGLGNPIQLARPMAFEMPVDRHHVHRELMSGVLHGHAAFDRRHNPFP